MLGRGTTRTPPHYRLPAITHHYALLRINAQCLLRAQVANEIHEKCDKRRREMYLAELLRRVR